MNLKCLLAAACASGFAAPSYAAIAITEIEVSPAATGDVLSRGDYALVSATAGGETYSDFVLPASVTTPGDGSSADADFFFWANSDNPTVNSPGSAQNALNDNLISTGAANLLPTVQFASTLDQYTRFFLFELGGNDALTLVAVDAAGNDLDLTASIAIGTWGNVATGATANSVSGAGTGTVAGFQRSDNQTGEGTLVLPVAGLSFTLEDFAGSASAADATGFRIQSPSSGLDLMLVTATPVPEPTTALLLGGAGLWLGASRRRRAV